MGGFRFRRSQVRAGQSFALPQEAVALSPAVSGEWTAGAEQQPSGAQHQALRDRPQELSLCQHPAGRPGQRGDLQPDRDSQRNRAGSIPLSDLGFENRSNAGSYCGGLGRTAAPSKCTGVLPNYITCMSRSAETNQLCGPFIC